MHFPLPTTLLLTVILTTSGLVSAAPTPAPGLLSSSISRSSVLSSRAATGKTGAACIPFAGSTKQGVCNARGQCTDPNDASGAGPFDNGAVYQECVA